MNDTNEFMKLAEVAELLQVSPATIRRLMKIKNKFPAPIRIGRQLRWRRNDIEAFCDAQRDDFQPTGSFFDSFKHLADE